MAPVPTEDRWWAEYPLNLDSYDPIRHDPIKIQDALANTSAGGVLSEVASSYHSLEDSAKKKAQAVSLRVIDIFLDQGVGSLTETLCTTEDEAEQFFAAPDSSAAKRKKNHRIRIISIHSKKTTGPLLTTPKVARKLLAAYKVSPDFLQLLLSFKRNGELTEHANNNFYKEVGPSGSSRIQYEFRYMEPSRRAGDELVERHTGVYHEHQADFDLYILLQSKLKTTAEERLCQLQESCPEKLYKARLAELCKHPFQVHTLVLSSYILNWRPYLETLVQESSGRSDPAMVLTPGKGINFDQVQGLRSTQDKVISAKMNCTRGSSILKGLEQMKLEDLKGLNFYATQLEGFIDSFALLQGKNHNAIELIDFILDRSIQEDTAKVYAELNKHTAHVHALTKDSVKNNITVKAVTFVSAFYLPGSFVATLFGMNFIGVNLNKTKITVTSDVWIFFLIWILLSVGTFAVYLFISKFEERRQEKREAAVEESSGSRIEKAE